MFLVEEEGTASSFRGVREVIEARGRSERLFRTHQDRLTKALALAGITGMAEANRYLKDSYPPAFTREFMPPALEDAPAFSPMWGRTWWIVCANSMSAWSARTTAWPSRV